MCSGCQNAAADALSRALAKNYDVCVVSASDEQNEALIRAQAEQRKDGELSQIINHLEGKSLPKDAAEAKKTVIAANKRYFLVDGILYYE